MFDTIYTRLDPEGYIIHVQLLISNIKYPHLYNERFNRAILTSVYGIFTLYRICSLKQFIKTFNSNFILI